MRGLDIAKVLTNVIHNKYRLYFSIKWKLNEKYIYCIRVDDLAKYELRQAYNGSLWDTKTTWN